MAVPDASQMRLLIHDYAGHPFPVGLSRLLATRGHTVVHAYASHLLTPRGDLTLRGDGPGTLSFYEVPMSPDYRANKYSFLKRYGHEKRYGRELERLIDDFGPDVILSGQTPSDPQWQMIKAARARGIPVVTWVQDFYSIAVENLLRKKNRLLARPAGYWYRRLDTLCFRESAAVVAITEDFVPILEAFGVPRSKIEVIPNWAPIEDLPLHPKASDWSKRWELQDKFVFLYSGTLAMKHNPELLHLLAMQYRDREDVRVVVISEGPGREYLARAKAAGQLTNLLLLPFQQFQEMPQALASADVLVAVLERDAGVFSVPSKVLTYHAAQRPILGAMPLENLAARLIETQKSGLCVPPDDIPKFLEHAESLRVDAALRANLGANARRFAEQEFDLPRITSRFERIFQRVCNGRDA